MLSIILILRFIKVFHLVFSFQVLPNVQSLLPNKVGPLLVDSDGPAFVSWQQMWAEQNRERVGQRGIVDLCLCLRVFKTSHVESTMVDHVRSLSLPQTTPRAARPRKGPHQTHAVVNKAPSCFQGQFARESVLRISNSPTGIYGASRGTHGLRIINAKVSSTNTHLTNFSPAINLHTNYLRPVHF